MRRGRTVAVLCAASVVAACAGQLPSIQGLGRLGQQALPIGPEAERSIGFGIAATLAGRYKMLADDKVSDYVNLVGNAVAQQSVRVGEVSFHFGVLDTDDVNAFAAPGGYILVTRGALALMESEAELAGVLGHEIGHVDQKHVVEAIRKSAVFAQAQEETDLQGPLLDRISEAGTTLLFTGLSREDELQADSLGLLYAAATGYRGDGLMDFLRHLRTAEGASSGGVKEWVATHPSTDERIQIVQRQLTGRPAGGADGAARFKSMVRKQP